jgi:DNA-binding transcriptional LysR family regulator
LAALVAVADERSFTRAAKRLGVSQSALSQTIRNLEERVGVRLLTRTTRSVAPTEAGERLIRTVAPRFAEIDAELVAVSELKDTPTGTVRITSTENAAEAILWPALERLLPDYPDIKVEILIDYGLTDIVTEQVDAGVRPGETDMIAVPIGPDMRMAVVGSPAYLKTRSVPRTPQELTQHNCINLRLPAHRGLYVWEFERNGRDLRVRVGFSVAGARPFRAIISTIPAADSLQRRLRCWSTACATAHRPRHRASPEIMRKVAQVR